MAGLSEVNNDLLSSSNIDRHQDIARSTYADMLHDDERNRAYDAAIKLSVATLIRSVTFNPDGNKYFYCCDIGTGSGLLSMMIVRAFKELNYHLFHVTSFEEFRPMASCARKVIERNNMSEQITVVSTRSDMYEESENSFDLLVAELLDTELIGEGCLPIYRHAIEKLCSPNCLFVPHKANIYIQPIASTLLFGRQTIDDYEIELETNKKVHIIIPDDIKNCCAYPNVVDDFQVSQLVEDKDFYKLTNEPKLIFQFTFNNLQQLNLSETKEVDIVFTERITQPPMLVMWWDIIMYNDEFVKNNIVLEEIDNSLKILSCAPTWARSNEMIERDKLFRAIYNRDVWREHWLQGVYYFKNITETRKLVLNQSQQTSKEQTIKIIANHDDHSLWFDIKQINTVSSSNNNVNNETNNHINNGPGYCSCGVHRILTRSQISFLNDRKEMTKLLKSYFSSSQIPNSFDSITGELQIRLIPPPIEEQKFSFYPKWRILFEDEMNDEHNPLTQLEPFLDLGLQETIPWELPFVCLHDKLIASLGVCGENFQLKSMNPIESFTIKFTQVLFDNLNRIRMKIINCEGFDVTDVDYMIKRSSNLVDRKIDSDHYLWEYPCKRLDKDYIIYSSEIDGSDHEIFKKIFIGTYWKNFELPIKYQSTTSNWKKGWALVIWVEFKLSSTNEIISTGPIEDCKLFEKINWNKNFKQMVYFMHNHPLKQVSGNYTNVSIDIGLFGKMAMPLIENAIDYNTPP